MKSFVVMAVVAVLGAASPGLAQSGWTAELSGGTATPVGEIGARLSTGWDADLGVGYQFNQWLAVLGDFGFAGMAVPDSVLQEFNAPNGHGRIVTLMANPRVGFPLTRRVHGFVTGGVGWIHRAVDLTAPALQYIDSYDPFYGDLGPQAIETDQVLSSVTRDALGGNFGGGIDVPLESIGADLIIGVRYYRGPTSPRVTAMVPVTFGIRWVSKGP